jgi:hypothetical protein
MATSPLDPSNLTGRPDRILGKGHGTRALGPSDSSDSGSDVSDAGAGIGDENLDSDTDRFGTGESASATGDVPEGADNDTDYIELEYEAEQIKARKPGDEPEEDR